MGDQASSLWWGLGGTVWGVFIAFCSVAVAGAGHGWVSALPFGVLAIVAAPLAAVAWARRNTNGRKPAIIAVVISVVSDVLLVVATFAEGTEFFFEVLPMAIFWIAIWSSWQMLAFITLLYRPTSIDT